MSWKLISKGKVRSVYENEAGTRIILVASDGVSAFDHELGVNVPGKGRLLTKISKYWFDKTLNIVPNAYCSVRGEFGNMSSSRDLLDIDGAEDDLGNVTPMMKLDMLPIEAIVRGYITGSAWEKYAKGAREICGERLPEDLLEASKLPTPIFTPTTKAPIGEHDQDLNFDQLVGYLSANGVLNPYSRAELVKEYSLELFNFASEELLKKGIVLVDTKFEFGINPVTGNILLADEVLTPDSSRFWSVEDYKPGRPQKSLDKQVIRDWIKKHPDERVPNEVLEDTAIIYNNIADIITTD